MAILPPLSSPKKLVADLRAFLAARQKHQLVFAALSVAIPASLAIQFYFQPEAHIPYKPPEVVYVQQWSKARTDAEVKAQQAKDAPAERQARKEQAEAEAEHLRQARALKKALNL